MREAKPICVLPPRSMTMFTESEERGRKSWKAVPSLAAYCTSCIRCDT